MSSHLVKAVKKGKATPPKWLPDNVQYEVITGSYAYGISTDTSDMDIYGWAIPPKELIFPHLAGEIPGFGVQLQRFEQYQEHHVQVDAQEYDFTIFSVVKYFQLCMENNPNMIDTLFVPDNCVTHMTGISQLVRDARKSFLHKGAFHKFRGYAHAQLHKINTKENASNPKRQANIEKYGYDLKFAAHCVRLLNECEQILSLGDLDLQRDNEAQKAVRRGDWTKEQVFEWAKTKEVQLEEIYGKSTLPHSPNVEEIKRLLLNVLESHYGSISQVVQIHNQGNLLDDLKKLMEKYE